MVHVVGNGIEGWIPARRWVGALRIVVCLAVAALLLVIGFDLGLQVAISVVSGR
jgi:autotransporter translocation and assembly factor TamB